MIPSEPKGLSAQLLTRALTCRGLCAAVATADRLDQGPLHTPSAPHVVLVDADAEPHLVEEHCRAVRQALPEARLLLLATTPEHDLARLVNRHAVDGFVSKAAGLDGLESAVRAAARGRPTRPSRSAPLQREADSAVVARLTAREREVLRLVATGATNSAVALQLDISPHTVRSHVQNVLAKLGAENRLAATAMARRAGLLPGPAPAHLLDAMAGS